VKWFDSEHCLNGKNCEACKHEAGFRRDIVHNFDDVDDIDFKCPYERAPKPIYSIADEYQNMALDALIAEVKTRDASTEMAAVLKRVKDKEWQGKKCPSCWRQSIERLLRRLLTREDEKHGA
jgi:hypothetical protein